MDNKIYDSMPNKNTFENLIKKYPQYKDYFDIVVFYNLGKERLDEILSFFYKKINRLSFKKEKIKFKISKQIYNKTRQKIIKINILIDLYEQATRSFKYETLVQNKKGRETYIKFIESVSNTSNTENLCNIMGWDKGLKIDNLKKIEEIIVNNFTDEDKNILKNNIIEVTEDKIKEEFKRKLKFLKKKHESILDRILKNSKE